MMLGIDKYVDTCIFMYGCLIIKKKDIVIIYYEENS